MPSPRATRARSTRCSLPRPPRHCSSSAQPALARRRDRRHAGAAHLGPDPHPAPARARAGERRGALRRGRWIRARRGFLFPVKALSQVFRGKFLAALGARSPAGALPSRAAPRRSPSRARSALCSPRCARSLGRLRQAPLRRPRAGARLPRPLHPSRRDLQRAARLSSASTVRFRYKDYAHGKRRKTMRLAALEFLRRFPLHVLPPASCASATTACSPTATSARFLRAHAPRYRPPRPRARPRRQNRSRPSGNASPASTSRAARIATAARFASWPCSHRNPIRHRDRDRLPTPKPDRHRAAHAPSGSSLATTPRVDPPKALCHSALSHPPRTGTHPASSMHATPRTSPHPQPDSIPKHNRSRVEPSGSVQLTVSAMLPHDGYDPVR